MSNGVEQILTLIREHDFQADEEGAAWGEVGGIPASLALLDQDPPAVMLGFRVPRDTDPTAHIAPLVQPFPSDLFSLSADDGCLWLSLYDVDALPPNSLTELPRRIVDALKSANLAVAPGCQRCGNLQGAVNHLIEQRPTRMCPDCTAAIVDDKLAAEEELNRATLSSTLGLPGAMFYVVFGWIAFWTVVDLILEYFTVDKIEINKLTFLVGFAVCAGVGYALGWPLGATMRRSVGLRKFPRLSSGMITLATVVVGEIGYIAVWILRMAGIFDLGAAVTLLWPALSTYSGFWICCKLALASAIGIFCANSASHRKTVSLDV